MIAAFICSVEVPSSLVLYRYDYDDDAMGWHLEPIFGAYCTSERKQVAAESIKVMYTFLSTLLLGCAPTDTDPAVT